MVITMQSRERTESMTSVVGDGINAMYAGDHRQGVVQHRVGQHGVISPSRKAHSFVTSAGVLLVQESLHEV